MSLRSPFRPAAERGPVGAGGGAVVLAAWIIAATLAALSLHASYPGHLNADSFEQLRQILNGRIDDWQSPFVTLLWFALIKVLPGPVGYIVLDNLLIWGALAVQAGGMARRAGAAALWVLAVPLLPGAVNFLGNVHRDALLAACLLAAFAAAFRANGTMSRGRAFAVLLVAANLGAVAAFLIRPNAVFCLVPLLLYANRRLGSWRAPATGAAVIALAVWAAPQVGELAQARKTHPADSIKTYHLLALSHFAGRNLLPGDWSADEARRIVDACYTPIQWDAAGMQGACGFVQTGLLVQKRWGSRELTEAWLREAAARPLALYAAMGATFARAMWEPNSRAMLYPPPRSAQIDWRIADDPPRATTAWYHAWIRAGINDAVGRPWVFAALMALAAAQLLARGLLATRLGLFAAALAASGALYLLTYFPFNVSAEFRYFYWCGFAGWLSAICAVLALRERRRDAAAADAANATSRQRGERSAALALGALCAAMVALVATPVELASTTRRVAVTVEQGTVAVGAMHSASLPPWLGTRFEGALTTGNWQRAGETWQGRAGDGALSAAIPMLRQSVVISLRAPVAAEGARVRIEADGETRQIELPPDASEIRVELAPPGSASPQVLADATTPLRTAFLFVVLLAAYLLLALRGSRESAMP
ncbi:MAG: hypothetical protein E6R11_01235 [Rhodocyclaceae bacterium]|jgi:hypothetical protein|nr:MAG: hypothetical protein E6R11_01235 [Rhodocyclaceae bacterium]